MKCLKPKNKNTFLTGSTHYYENFSLEKTFRFEHSTILILNLFERLNFVAILADFSVLFLVQNDAI